MSIVFNEKDEKGIEALRIIDEKKGRPSLLVQEGNTYYLKFTVDDYYKANNFIYPFFSDDYSIIQNSGIKVTELRPGSYDEWIPVNKKLPGDEEAYPVEEDYLVIDADGNCAIGYYRKDCDAWDSSEFGWLERQADPSNHYTVSGIGKVVAWMPLPGPYKAESER